MLIWNRIKYLLSPQFDIYKEVSKIVSGSVVDIGFGTGFGTHLLAQNAEVIGYEIDEAGIKFATDAFPNVSFKYGNIQEGINGTFDFVVMIDVLEHLRQNEKSLINVKKMLNNTGKLILSTPNRLSRYRKSDDHIREYAPNELEGILKRYFKNVEIKNYKLEPPVSQFDNPIIAICWGK